ncbi:MAG: O-antigen ligase domain-containing protein [Oxalobacteraceae bacterium]|nr:MAG: O-antigen ligase domain-containing protein [Oxalobacteraceae bacterium]
MLFPLILVTGSRSGLLVSLAGFGAAIAVLAPRMRRRGGILWRVRSGIIVTIGLVGIGLMAWLTMHLAKAEAIVRLLNTSKDSEFRLDIWKVSLDLLWKYFPVGSGSGSFQDVYRIIEPAYQLNPSYRNHAHQEILEVGIALGLPGLLILLAAIIGFGRRSMSVWFQQSGKMPATIVARMSSVAMAMIAFSSLGDYPLRTPMMMCTFTLLFLWLAEADRLRLRGTAPLSARESER